MSYTPVFIKDGNRFVVPYADFISDTSEEAWQTGIGASLVECIIWGARYCGETFEFDANVGFLHATASIMDTDIYVISGPIYDEAAKLPRKDC
jgi:hypothetical protein